MKFFYRVNKGETVLSLSLKFGVPPFEIIENNSLTKEVEYGDVLYLEQSGCIVCDLFETYESLSEKTGVGVDRLKVLNGRLPYLFYGLVVKISE